MENGITNQELNTKIVGGQETKIESTPNVITKTDSITKLAIGKILDDMFVDSGGIITKEERLSITRVIKDEAAKSNIDLTKTQIDALFRRAKNDYYNKIEKQSPEALRNIINDKIETYENRIVAESNKDIVDQVKVINQLLQTSSSINKINELAPNITIQFETNFSQSDFLKENI